MSVSASSATPELLFLDEPTTGFDPSARRGAWELVDRLRGEGTTIILTTHYMDEAQHLADRVVVINRGEIVAAGTPETIGGRIRGRGAHPVRACRPTSTPRRCRSAATRDSHGIVRARDERRGAGAAHAHVVGRSIASVDLVGLTVDRPSLEDVYLELTSAEVGG